MSKNKKNIFTSLINKLNFFKKKENSEDLENVKKINKKKHLNQNKLSLNKKNLKKTNVKSITSQKPKKVQSNLLFFLKKKFTNIRKSVFSVIKNFFSDNKLNKKFLKKLEDQLISFDINIHTTKKIIDQSIKDLEKKDLKNISIIYKKIFFNMNEILKKSELSSFSNRISSNLKYPNVILFVGVNGSGKTTTIAKLSKLYKDQNKTVLVAAADTFRDAAIDQLDILCKQNKIDMVSKRYGSDPASVVYEAFQKAVLKKFDILMIDTAGRFHTKINLMNELKKIVNVIHKLNQNTSIDIFLTIDSCTGQNSLVQTEFFHKFLKITGIILTKFDSTSKGGIIFSIADQFYIPVRYITTGESMKDICIFNNFDFINSLFKSK
ncbi:signal recognition particle-docking protein FtsY [Buchnera aphidicola]|uniref:signal recognition particle-docking protein FtsY n=1 Tax=Buchnera aphidicola TaxID=9 RepID=UPI002237BDFB|nr:signal recognition particle-docking protein FtsY [Buchnera aphidicola]MCW5197401.1 signal recognition particle-docking protein FtsY [Buchnera aphidicola (Chaitophorus viminalis)]